MLNDQEAILNQLQQNDQYATTEPVYKDVFLHAEVRFGRLGA